MRRRTPARPTTIIPSGQIKIIVPFPGGAGPDHVARLLGKHLQEAFGQPVMIENRAGALGSIGAQEVAHAAPDGYTLLMGTNTTHASNVATLKNPGYDPVKDFAPIIRTTTTAMVLLVKPNFPAKDLPQFLDYTRSHKQHDRRLWLRRLADFGGATAVARRRIAGRGLLSRRAAGHDRRDGRRDRPHLRRFLRRDPADAGRHAARHRRHVADSATSCCRTFPRSPKRCPASKSTIWYGLLAPANTPEPIVNKLYDESEKFLTLPDTRKRLADVGVIVAPQTPAEFGDFISSEIVRWAEACKAAGIEPQ